MLKIFTASTSQISPGSVNPFTKEIHFSHRQTQPLLSWTEMKRRAEGHCFLKSAKGPSWRRLPLSVTGVHRWSRVSGKTAENSLTLRAQHIDRLLSFKVLFMHTLNFNIQCIYLPKCIVHPKFKSVKYSRCDLFSSYTTVQKVGFGKMNSSVSFQCCPSLNCFVFFQSRKEAAGACPVVEGLLHRSSQWEGCFRGASQNCDL